MDLMTGDVRRVVTLGVLILAIAAGCGAGRPGSASDPSLPAGVPVPRDATPEVGMRGPGFDGGADVYAFTSSLAPAAAARTYAIQLADAGFIVLPPDGAWLRFRKDSVAVAVDVGTVGPPTLLVVRVGTVSFDQSGEDPSATGQPSRPGQDGSPPPGQGGTPPGQDGSPPPGQGGTPPGQDGSPPPGQGGTPPGQDGSPPPGQDGSPPPGQGGTPPGQDGSPPPGQGGTPPGQDGSPPPGQGEKPPKPDPPHGEKAPKP
ncbi:MAG: hypothetical protein C0498_10405 [Anaerolinea sp.]|nr:hypothetical protein [Anaerolinea sp.]